MSVLLSSMIPPELSPYLDSFMPLGLSAFLDHILYQDMDVYPVGLSDDETEDEISAEEDAAPPLISIGSRFGFSFHGSVADSLELGFPAIAGMQLVLGSGQIRLDATVDLANL